MNRLILIGNGFDLANGYKTRYSDFMHDYLKKIVDFFNEKGSYEDRLISIIYRTNDFYTNGYFKPKTNDLLGYIELIKYIESKKQINLRIKSHLFNKLFKKIGELKWVDIEYEYYKCLEDTQDMNHDFNYEKIKTLNEDLNFIKNKLEEYLNEHINTFRLPNGTNKFYNLFTENIKKEDLILKDLTNHIKPEEIYFLCFNYTPIIEDTFYKCNLIINSTLNYIHGQLKETKNPIIFGFGDEHDKYYQVIEEEYNNTLFEHIKSFAYLKTSKYGELIRFINGKDYQVYIVGHSCGISDRTMLKEIFEHDNCKSIKIFYHDRADGTNDYTEKTHEISRHFTNKGLMRKKVVPFELSSRM